MKRLSILGVFCLAAACAHAPNNSPVRVIVNATDGAVGRVDTAVLQRVTENELHRASSARPLTLTVFFNAFGFVEKPGRALPRTYDSLQLVSAQAVSDLSATPWDEGLVVQSGDH